MSESQEQGEDGWRWLRGPRQRERFLLELSALQTLDREELRALYLCLRGLRARPLAELRDLLRSTAPSLDAGATAVQRALALARLPLDARWDLLADAMASRGYTEMLPDPSQLACELLGAMGAVALLEHSQDRFRQRLLLRRWRREQGWEVPEQPEPPCLLFEELPYLEAQGRVDELSAVGALAFVV